MIPPGKKPQVHYAPSMPDDPAVQADIMEQLKQFDPHAPGVKPHDERNSDNLSFVTIQRRMRAAKGKWRIFPMEAEDRKRKAANHHLWTYAFLQILRSQNRAAVQLRPWRSASPTPYDFLREAV
jgi:hypothetical protein